MYSRAFCSAVSPSPIFQTPLLMPSGSSLGQDVCPTVAGKVRALDEHVWDDGLVNSALYAT